mmetsp:Transcript_18563/g.18642  ORF Transcript_18563/g.18642 Transcript_18563/m.18642 type:complete len:781 (+) Transcript_18563:58-2400(+)
MSGESDTDLGRRFREFLEAQEHDGKYLDRIQTGISDKLFRVIININDLRIFDNELAAGLLRRPREHILALQQVSTQIAKGDAQNQKLLNTNELQVGFEGSFGSNSVSPRGLTSSLLNKLVVVEGIVTKFSSVRPKLVRSAHYSVAEEKHTTRDYRDNTALDIGLIVNDKDRLPTSSAIPSKDDNGNPLEIEHGLCIYKDYQTVVLQEMPERAKVGQLPRSIEMILEHDLVDRLKPGDRAQCVGVYRALAPAVQNGQTSGVFKSILICNNVSVIGKDVGAVKLTGSDIRNIRELSDRPGVLDILSRSLCPSIFGHEFIKKALVLQLLGGCERNLSNGTHLRGDINVMMVGDPSTAKSQLLRAVMDIAPLAISTTGRGSSGVGLTAAVTSDEETGEKRLEAGAMVLADRGIVCIDEFDKMGERDRVAIHEVMEQQTVTIAKAGIHASLNARCSVLSAANPIYGQYDRELRPQQNIGLPDSLLSRFDLLFIVLDQLDPTIDRCLAEHVVKSHQYRRPGTIMEPEPLNAVSTLHLEDQGGDVKDTPMWQRGGRGAEFTRKQGEGCDVLTKDFLRKYVHFAKTRAQPEMTPDAMEKIAHEYAGMREKQTNRNLPVTARTLETIIRVASAHAKSRLSAVVEDVDADGAMELINFVLFHEVSEARESETSEEVIASSSVSSRRGREEEKSLKEGRGKKQRLSGPQDEDEMTYVVDKHSQRYESITTCIGNLASSATHDGFPSEDLIDVLNTSASVKKPFTHRELDEYLKVLESDNKIMYVDGIITVV